MLDASQWKGRNALNVLKFWIFSKYLLTIYINAYYIWWELLNSSFWCSNHVLVKLLCGSVLKSFCILLIFTFNIKLNRSDILCFSLLFEWNISCQQHFCGFCEKGPRASNQHFNQCKVPHLKVEYIPALLSTRKKQHFESISHSGYIHQRFIVHKQPRLWSLSESYVSY